jgi:hypothetical protein
MQQFAELEKEMAHRYGGTFVDLNAPVVEVLKNAEAKDHAAAQRLLPDRVHPEPLAHWVMAEALLKGWNAPALVSAVTIDAQGAKATQAENAAVDRVERDGGTLRWSEIEGSLPLAFSRDNALRAQLLDLSDIEKQLNQEPLRVTGLAAGEYKLTIDQRLIGTFQADELAGGINLVDYDTPMRAQSERVSWSVRDRDEAQYIRLRMHVRNFDSGGEPGKDDVLGRFERTLENSIYELAASQAHQYVVAPADAKAQ